MAGAVRAISKYQWNVEGLIDQRFIERALHQEGPQREAARTAAAGALALVAPDSPLLSYLNPLLQDDCARSFAQCDSQLRKTAKPRGPAAARVPNR